MVICISSRVVSYLQIAAWIGAEAVLIVPGATRVAWDDSRPVIRYKTVWEKATLSVKELLPVAEKLFFTGKKVFLLSPDPSPLFKKSGVAVGCVARPVKGTPLDNPRDCQFCADGTSEKHTDVVPKSLHSTAVNLHIKPPRTQRQSK